MILAAMLGLAVAAFNVAVSQWFRRRAMVGSKSFLGYQAIGFLFRFATIFGAVTWIWRAHRKMEEVVVFIIVGAVAQMTGQIHCLLRDRKSHE